MDKIPSIFRYGGIVIYLILNSKKPKWQVEYEELIYNELSKHREVVPVYDPINLDFATEDDYVWIMSYEDLKLVSKDRAYKVIMQSHGSSILGFMDLIDPSIEKEQMTKLIDYNLTFNKNHTKILQRYFPGANFVEFGFPLKFGFPHNIDHINIRKKKKIVFTGSDYGGKNIELSIFLLEKYIKDPEWEVVYCRGKDSQNYNNNLLGLTVKTLSREEWLKELNSAEYYFTCSLADTIQTSLAEAMLNGCMVIIPDFKKKDRMLYTDYIEGGIRYKPFCREELEMKISNYARCKDILDIQLKNRIDIDNFDPEICIRRILKIYE